MVIPQMPPGSAEHVPAGLSGLGYLGSLCGQESVVYMPGEREEKTPVCTVGALGCLPPPDVS